MPRHASFHAAAANLRVHLAWRSANQYPALNGRQSIPDFSVNKASWIRFTAELCQPHLFFCFFRLSRILAREQIPIDLSPLDLSVIFFRLASVQELPKETAQPKCLVGDVIFLN